MHIKVLINIRVPTLFFMLFKANLCHFMCSASQSFQSSWSNDLISPHKILIIHSMVISYTHEKEISFIYNYIKKTNGFFANRLELSLLFQISPSDQSDC